MKFKVFSLGCKVNSYECFAISSLLINSGYQEAENDVPDVFIINTCSVTSTADQKSRQHIRKFIAKYPNAISIVMGCYAQGNAEFIFNEIQPTIVIGTSNRNLIPELINEYLKTKKRILKVDENPRKFCYEELGITAFSENIRAYLKIQDGCDNFCTYCIVPFRRGKMRSRNPEFVYKEAESLVKKGYQEIVLSGIHVGGYGKDLGNISFSELIENLLNIEGLNSLRVSSIEESEIDDKLISLASRSNFANHFHIPLQSGSSTVLKRMGRKYTPEEFKNKIVKIKQKVKDVMISGDVIVGFPGETDEEFNETYQFIKECGFNQLHVFPYSPREGTVAARLKDQIDPKIKNERANKLIELSNKLWKEYVHNYIGKEVIVLIEKYENNQNIGHTSNYIEVSIPSKEGRVGERLTVKLQESMIVSK